LRYYQTLDASQYERLSSYDKFIDRQYMVYMLHDYIRQCGEENYTKLMSKLSSMGVNIERLQATQQAYDQALQQQAYQEAPESEEASVSLEEALGE